MFARAIGVLPDLPEVPYAIKNFSAPVLATPDSDALCRYHSIDYGRIIDSRAIRQPKADW